MYGLRLTAQELVKQLVQLYGGYLLIDKQDKLMAVRQQFYTNSSGDYAILSNILRLAETIAHTKYQMTQILDPDSNIVPARKDVIVTAQHKNGELVLLDEFVVEFVDPLIVEGEIVTFVVYQNVAEVRKHVKQPTIG